MALRADGSVLAWGADQSGQLGDGGPMHLDADGFSSAIPRARVGTGQAWGSGANGELGVPAHHITTPTPVPGLQAGTGVIAVDAGYGRSLALRADGAVLSWGGEFACSVASCLTPKVVTGLGAGSGVVDIAAGDGHNLVLRSDGSVLGWGADAAGQVGDGDDDGFGPLPLPIRPTPVPVVGLGPGSGVVEVSAAETHSMALLRGEAGLCAGRR